MPDTAETGFREDYLRLWIAEDGSKSLLILRAEDGSVRVTIWEGLGEKIHAEERQATWHPREVGEEGGSYARERLGFLSVELGTPGLGNTYDLMIGAPGEPIAEAADLQWGFVRQDVPIDEVRLFPEAGGSYYDAVLGPYDDCSEDMREAETWWVEPLSTYRPATAEEVARHLGLAK
jgi:hypothetical protein